MSHLPSGVTTQKVGCCKNENSPFYLRFIELKIFCWVESLHFKNEGNVNNKNDDSKVRELHCASLRRLVNFVRIIIIFIHEPKFIHRCKRELQKLASFHWQGIQRITHQAAGKILNPEEMKVSTLKRALHGKVTNNDFAVRSCHAVMRRAVAPPPIGTRTWSRKRDREIMVSKKSTPFLAW